LPSLPSGDGTLGREKKGQEFRRERTAWFSRCEPLGHTNLGCKEVQMKRASELTGKGKGAKIAAVIEFRKVAA